MAKKQGLPSILGGTDATLVNAAYKAAMANVPRSLQPVYEQIGNSFERGMSALGKGLGDLAKAAGDVGAALIEKQKEEDENTGATRSYKNNTDFTTDSTVDPTVSSQETPEFNANQKHIDSSGNAVDFTVGDLEDELEKINKELRTLMPVIGGSELKGSDRKKRRSELKDRRDNIFESAKEYEVSSKLIGEYLKPENFVVNPERIDEANFLRALKNNGKPLGDGSRALKGYDKQGNIIFSYVDRNGKPITDAFENPLTVDQNSVKRLIVPANGKVSVSFANNEKSAFDNGVQGITLSDYDKNQIALSTTEQIHTTADFEWAASRKFGGKSLFEDLNSTDLSKTSFRLFSSLNIAAFDSDKSGKVDINDFANDSDNYKKLKSALLNPRDPNFNLGVSKAFLGDFAKDQAAIINNQGLQKYVPSADGGDGTATERENARKVQSFVATANDVQAGEEAPPINLGGGNFLSIKKDPNVDQNDPKGGLILELTSTDEDTDERTVRQVNYQSAIDMLTENSGFRAKDVFKDQTWYVAGATGFNSANVLGALSESERKDDDAVIPVLRDKLRRNYPDKFKVSEPRALFAQEIKIEVRDTEPPKSITLNVNDADFNENLDKFINENAE
tara:strand:- start:3213 stop:5072 length:1860 start_codon:yes stop_codon:yes gene_type:complete